MKTMMRVVALAVPFVSTSLPASVFMYWTGAGPASAPEAGWRLLLGKWPPEGGPPPECGWARRLPPAPWWPPAAPLLRPALPWLAPPAAASNVFSLAQTSLLKVPAVKRALGLPDLSKLATPAATAAAGLAAGKPVTTYKQPPPQHATVAAAAATAAATGAAAVQPEVAAAAARRTLQPKPAAAGRRRPRAKK